MKKYLLVILTILVLFACDKVNKTGPLTWTLKDGVLTISGQGEMPNYDFHKYNGGFANNAPWGKDFQNIRTIIINEGVNNIGENAFQNLINVLNVSIPGTVSTIGANAFYNCASLQSIILPDGVINIGEKAFFGCIYLYQIDFSNTVENIGNSAFEFCRNLNSVELPDSVVSIGESAFKDCKELINIIFGKNIQNIGDEAFYGCKYIQIITINNPNPPALRTTYTSRRVWVENYRFNNNVFEKDIFGYCNLIVPDEFITAYKEDENWKYFFMNIDERE